MGGLLEFRKWAVRLGHYHAHEAVDRYLDVLAEEAKREVQVKRDEELKRKLVLSTRLLKE